MGKTPTSSIEHHFQTVKLLFSITAMGSHCERLETKKTYQCGQEDPKTLLVHGPTGPLCACLPSLARIANVLQDSADININLDSDFVDSCFPGEYLFSSLCSRNY